MGRTTDPHEYRSEYEIAMEGKVTLKTDSPWLLGIVLAVTLTSMLFLLFRVGKVGEKFASSLRREEGSGDTPTASDLAATSGAEPQPSTISPWQRLQRASRRLAIVVGIVVLLVLAAMVLSTWRSATPVPQPPAANGELKAAVDELARQVGSLPRSSIVVAPPTTAVSPTGVDSAAGLVALVGVVAITLLVLTPRRHDRGIGGDATGPPPTGPPGHGGRPGPTARGGPGSTAEEAVVPAEKAARPEAMAVQPLPAEMREKIAAVQALADLLIETLEGGSDVLRERSLEGLQRALNALGKAMMDEQDAVWLRFAPGEAEPLPDYAAFIERILARPLGPLGPGLGRGMPGPLPTASPTENPPVETSRTTLGSAIRQSASQWRESLDTLGAALRDWRLDGGVDRLVRLEDAVGALYRLTLRTQVALA